MQRRLVLKIATFIGAASTLGEPWALTVAESAGLVKTVQGSVRILRNGELLAAAPGSAIMSADRIQVAEKSSISITLRDGTMLTLGPRADLLLRHYQFAPQTGSYGFNAYLIKGSAIYTSGKIGKVSPESVRIDTPTGTVGVRGTRFVIEANESF